MRELPPIRCYYLVRNLLYFWLYEYHARTVASTAASDDLTAFWADPFGSMPQVIIAPL